MLLDLSRKHGVTVRIDPHWLDPARHGSMIVDLKLDNATELLKHAIEWNQPLQGG